MNEIKYKPEQEVYFIEHGEIWNLPIRSITVESYSDKDVIHYSFQFNDSTTLYKQPNKVFGNLNDLYSSLLIKTSQDLTNLPF